MKENIVRSIIYKEFAYAKAGLSVANQYLNRINPNVLLVEDGASPSRLVLQYVAKKRGIPVIELQHGLIVPDHPSYFFGITKAEQLLDSPFPDIIAVHGSHFKRILLQNNNLNSSRVVITGNPYYWMIRRKKNNVSTLQLPDKYILVSTEPQYRQSLIDKICELPVKTGYQLVIKPHPSEILVARERYKKLLENPMITLIQENISIYSLFERAVFHIAVGSMTHLEALAFGVKDILLAQDGLDGYYDFLIQMGLPVAHTSNELVTIINNYPDIIKVYSYVQNEIFSIQTDPTASFEILLGRYI